MELATAEQMRTIDRHAIETIGIPALVLMENAGRAIAEEALREAGKGRWLILVGKGNNGGDGIVCARHLLESGCEAHLLFTASPDELRGEAAIQRDIAKRIGIPSAVYGQAPVEWGTYVGVVDGLLGTGSSGAPKEPLASLIREANASRLPIVAADIPSGLNADTGEVGDPCIKARATVSLALAKQGVWLYPGAEYAGRVTVRHIGIPDVSVRSAEVQTFALDEGSLKEQLGVEWPLPRRADSHKGTYGHTLIVAGSRFMSGAGLLCASASLRAGSGLTTWAVPESLVTPLTGNLPEAMLQGVADEGDGGWGRSLAGDILKLAVDKQAVIVGPGVGRWDGDGEWLRQLWENIEAPLLLDADALNIAADAGFGAWARRSAPTVFTPHPGEMARLCGISVADVQRDRVGLARAFARRHGIALALKGARTVISAPDGRVFVNATGNPAMAKGGSGDVLAGIVGSLLAQGLDVTAAAALGVHVHGAAGDRAAAARPSPSSLLAGDIVAAL